MTQSFLPAICMSADHQREMAQAFSQLERETLIKRLSDYAGAPVSAALKRMPQGASEKLQKVVLSAMWRCLDAAIFSAMTAPDVTPFRAASSMMVGVSGGVGGLLGVFSLPFELPVTTMLMLRAIAEIAQEEGEDLSTPEARLACLEVFALGSRTAPEHLDFGYYASRVVLSRLSQDGAAQIFGQSASLVSSAIFGGFIREVSSRFSSAVSQRAAASAAPLFGAIGGATLNVLFMNHFQTLARGHFTVRRLERVYGAPAVKSEYIKLYNAYRRTSEAQLRDRRKSA